MSLAKEFKEFAMKGNVIDMAVGVVVGAAFGKIIASIVDDVIMPPLGLLIGGVDTLVVMGFTVFGAHGLEGRHPSTGVMGTRLQFSTTIWRAGRAGA